MSATENKEPCPQCAGRGYLLLAQRVGPGLGFFMAQCLLCKDHERFVYAFNYAQIYGHEPPDEEIFAFGKPGAKILQLFKPPAAGGGPSPFGA